MADPIPRNTRADANRGISDAFNRANDRRERFRQHYGVDPVQIPQHRGGIQRQLELNDYAPPIPRAGEMEREIRDRNIPMQLFGASLIGLMVITIAIIGTNEARKKWIEENEIDLDFYQAILNDLETNINIVDINGGREEGIEGILRTLHILRSITLEITNPILKDRITCFIESTEILVSLNSPDTPLPGNFYNNYVRELRELKTAMNSYGDNGLYTNNDQINSLLREVECRIPVEES